MTETLQNRDPSGDDLRARRTELNMTLAQVAGALLLSQRHVEALEADDPAAFYNHTFYQQARRRYAVLLGLSAPPDVPVIAATEAEPEPQTLAQAPAHATAVSADQPRRAAPVSGARISAVLAMVIALALTALLVWQGETLLGMLADDPAPTPPLVADAPIEVPDPVPETVMAADPAEGATATKESATPAPASTDTPPPKVAPDAPKPLSGPVAGTAIESGIEIIAPAAETVYLFEAQRLCWVFARENSGKETKVTLKAGQRLNLPGQLSYLAVGDLAAVRVWVDGSERNLAAFSANGRVARLGPAELRVLRNGTSASSLSPTD